MSNVMGGIVVSPAVNMHAEKMSDEQRRIFDRAFAELIGAQFFPLVYVSSQVVSGVLHTYIATRRVVYPNAPTMLVKVVILQNPQNEASIHLIEEI